MQSAEERKGQTLGMIRAERDQKELHAHLRLFKLLLLFQLSKLIN